MSSYQRYQRIPNGILTHPKKSVQVVYVPFVPDMIARVDAHRAGSTVRHSSFW